MPGSPAGIVLYCKIIKALIKHQDFFFYLKMYRRCILIFNHVCFHRDDKKDYQVVLGGTNLGKTEETQQKLEVVETIIHEQYRETSESVYNDIGAQSLLYFHIDYCL